MSHPIVGIDLGTTYSALATINPAGKPEIVSNKEGERITASAVFAEKSGNLLVGQVAVDSQAAYHDRVRRWVKREMDNTTFRWNVDGKSYSAVDISAMILRKVRQDAEETLGPIRQAVVTVPAYFAEAQRRATTEAAQVSGLEVLRIINEPTAAALAYASTGRVTGRVLVYDFGGGTFDVTVVDIRSPQDVAVITSEGDHRLGGYDLDRKLASHLNDRFFERHGVRIDEMGDPGAWFSLVQRAEAAKRTLSSRQEALVSMHWHAHDANITVTRAVFEDLIGDFIVRTAMLVENALSAAKTKPGDIAHVLLVGGSTRIPAVQAMLSKKFNREPVRYVNPDEAVALGAAIQAGIIMQEKGLSNLPAPAAAEFSRLKLRDVTAHSFGTLCVSERHGRQVLRNSLIIPKNSPIPVARTEEFATIHAGQESINCAITQGEDEDPDFVNVIAEGKMPLPPGRPAGRKIQVTYAYNADGMMSAKFVDVESGRAKTFDMDHSEKTTNRPTATVDAAAFDTLDIQ